MEQGIEEIHKGPFIAMHPLEQTLTKILLDERDV